MMDVKVRILYSGIVTLHINTLLCLLSTGPRGEEHVLSI